MSGNQLPARQAVSPIIVALIDDAALTRECLARLIQAQAPDFLVRSGAHARDIIAGESPPAAMVVNGKAFDLDGTELADEMRGLAKAWPGVPRL